ncbi:MAG: autotransporter assembly complex family protein [Alphaproteobacteria bacterium]
MPGAARAVRFLAVLLAAASIVGIPIWRAAAAEDEFAYEVEFAGADVDDLESLLSDVSKTISRQDTPPATRRILESRVREDVAAFEAVLRSEGYYQGTVKSEIGEGAPLLVTFTVEPGAPFLISEITIDVEPPADDAEPPTIDQSVLGLQPGDRARSADIVSATDRAVAVLGTQGFPFAKLADRKVMVDHATKEVFVTLGIGPGPPASFGETAIEGLTGLDPDYVRNRLGWEQGEPYDVSKVDATRRTLSRAGLFSSIRISHADTVNPDGSLPITIALAEGPPRSFGGGISYSTDLGPGVKAFWEHRNLFGAAETLSVTGRFALSEQSLLTNFVKPDFPTPSERLLVEGEIKREDLDAYEATTARIMPRIEHALSDHATISVGGGFEQSEITDIDGTEQYSLFSTPVLYVHDSSDDPLEPTTGGRTEIGFTPYVSAFGDELNFFVTRIGDSVHWSPTGDGRIVLAARGALGSIFGAEVGEIPATKRLYAGGGGSVRGYAYQSVGPLDARNDPAGGRSLIEFNLEARFRIGESFGIVPFVDAGNVYDSVFPEFDGDLLWGAGLGFRYYTPIGPVRLDIAFPLNRRHGVDDILQFYATIGQAF